MSRLVNAAMQLIQDVTAINSNVKASASDKPDGFKRHRAVEFDARTSKWLADALHAVNDPRIASVEYEGKGKAVVHFVADSRADHRASFPIASAKAVLDGD